MKHYCKCNWLYCAVLILDPRLKLENFKKTKWGLEMIEKSYDKFLSILRTYSTDELAHARKNVEENNNVEDDYDGLYVTENIQTPLETELNLYLLCPRAPKETDILQWWKCNAHLYPTIAKMARDYLCIPATSVPCERVFSEAGNAFPRDNK